MKPVNEKETITNLSDVDIVEKLYKHWHIKEFKFIGKLTRNHMGAFFNTVLANKRTIIYPDKLGNVGVYCGNSDGLEADKYYQFHCQLAPLKFRLKNPYLLNVDTTKSISLVEDFELTESSNEYFIKDIYNIRGLTPDDAARTARQLRLNELELYTQTERFIFELIQNADDMPNSSAGVNINFILKSDFFIFLHNGLPFLKENVSAIADAGKSTKISDTQKTGYKGIGFKSVFSDAQTVYINSGNFSFRFDKDYYRDIAFETLYEYHIRTLNENGRKEFFARYKGKEKSQVQLENIPWQIKPIWTSYKEFPQDLRSMPDFFKKEVAIGLKIGTETIRSKNYNQILKTLFSEPRFLLFLRNVRIISIVSDEIDLQVNIFRAGFLKTIKSQVSPTDILEDNYITDKGYYRVNIDNASFKEVDVPILIIKENSKASFKKSDGTDLNNIPEKLANLNSTTLSFAAKIEDGKIVKLKENEAILFNYLPTNDSRFGFPYLVNADFITTTNRETIIAENLWNIYLFYYIGFYAIRWIADTALIKITDTKKENLRNSILGLVPKLLSDEKEIHRKFNAGVTKGISEIAFVPAEFNNKLLKIKETVFDKTGIFKSAFFYSSFKELFPDKELISYDLLYCSEKLCKVDVYGFETTMFEPTDIVKLFQLTNFSPSTDKKDNAKFINHLLKSKLSIYLKDFPSVLSRSKELKKPDELFIYIDEADQKSISFDKSLNFVSEEVELFARRNSDYETVLLTELGVKKFSPAAYIQSLLPQYLTINKYITATDVNIQFWKFILKYKKELPDNDKGRLENFVVITTDQLPMSLKECFLSGKYQTTYQIEEVAIQIGLTGLCFVDAIYASSPKEMDDFKVLFNECGARRSEGWELYRHKVKTLITSNLVTELNCLVITKFIFDVFRNNRSKFDVNESNTLKSLSLLTETNGMQKASQCIFSNQHIRTILPDCLLDNLISSKYAGVVEKAIEQDWKVFLLATGVIELSEAEIVKKKFLKVIANIKDIDIESSFKIWRFIFSYSDVITNDNNCKIKLKEIPLPLRNDLLASCNTAIIYYSKDYYPASDVELLMGSSYDVFLNSNLPENKKDIDKWKLLLNIAGVHEVIAHAGSGNNFEISHLENLDKYDYAMRFWSYFQEHFSVDNINTNSKFRVTVTQMMSIPCLDRQMRKPDQVFPNSSIYKNHINDETKISAFVFKDDVIAFLGLNTNLVSLETDNSYLKYLGNLGERYVYQQLKKDNASLGTIKEKEFGFVIENGGETTIEVIWNNKQFIEADIRNLADSGNPFDLSIITLEGTKYIEVKSTYMENNNFMMPESEWNWMLCNPQNYYIYRVNNAVNTPNISIKCLAIEALLSGNIKPQLFPVTIRI